MTESHPMDGVLVVDKPTGPTSHDVVAWARRILNEKRIGHTGTLDPLATGVLPLVIGKATRLASLLSASDKEYDAAVRLGATTATYDAAGRLSSDVPPAPPTVGRSDVESALEAFRGTFEQMPPPFSAKKVAGVPAYKLARKQKPTTLSAVQVTVHSLDLLDFDRGLVHLRMRTSAGFYVRSLAHDLGGRLGCGGYLEALRRRRAGGFGLNRAVTMEDLEREPALAAQKIVPLSELAADLPAVRVTPEGARRTAHGNYLALEDLAQPGRFPGPAQIPTESGAGLHVRVRVLDTNGQLLAIADTDADGLLRPSIVLV